VCFTYLGQVGQFVYLVFLVFSPVCVMLSVPVQVIAWKDSSLKWHVMCRAGRKTLLTNSLILICYLNGCWCSLLCIIHVLSRCVWRLFLCAVLVAVDTGVMSCRRTMIQCISCAWCQPMSSSKYLDLSTSCCHCTKVTIVCVIGGCIFYCNLLVSPG